MRVIRFLAALVAATALQVLGLELASFFFVAVDLLLVLVIFSSLDGGPLRSLLAGSVAGLAQDALTGGLYGLHGFADTVVAWAVARLRQRVVVQQPFQVGLLFALAAALQQAILAALLFLMLPGAEIPGPGTALLRMVSTGLLGAAAFALAGRLRHRYQEWRAQRRRRLALEVD